ncbi:17833_t:CDS:2, partial [Funneliformis geosporum]
MNSFRIPYTEGVYPSSTSSFQAVNLTCENGFNMVHEPHNFFLLYGYSIPMVSSSQSAQGSSTNYQEVNFINEPLCFYNNDFHIICKEILPSSLCLDQAAEILNINIHNPVRNNRNFYKFYYKQPDTLKIYEVICKMLKFCKFDNQQQEFSKKDQKSIKFCLTNYLGPITQDKEKTHSCKWKEEAIKQLLFFLEKNKGKINQLVTKRGGSGNIKSELWMRASILLFRKGYNYSAKQCEIKWKNIKKLSK